MDGLIAFLKARLDEDEEVARATRKNEQFVHGTDRWFASHNNAITSMAPHRAVAAVEAKRRMLALHAQGHECPSEVTDPYPNMTGWYDSDCPTITAMGTEWSTHDEYRQEWKP